VDSELQLFPDLSAIWMVGGVYALSDRSAPTGVGELSEPDSSEEMFESVR
jgi:hypothetical protein